ncbi:MAG TPA: hypothetical protein VF753_16445 [Terriglobales bacterium]
MFALIYPILIFCGKSDRVRRLVQAKADSSRDMPDSVMNMTLGINLLFWAFFLQLISLLIDYLQKNRGAGFFVRNPVTIFLRGALY